MSEKMPIERIPVLWPDQLVVLIVLIVTSFFYYERKYFSTLLAVHPLLCRLGLAI